MRCVKQGPEVYTYTALDSVIVMCSIRLQAHLQDGQAPATADEQQALQPLIISGFGPMKLLETLDQQPLHDPLPDRN